MLTAATIVALGLGCFQTGAAAVQVPHPSTQLPPLPVTQLDPREVTLDSTRRLTLTFAEPQPIRGVLDLLVQGTPFSLAVDSAVTGQFTGELKQLTLREALTTLLAPLGLDFSTEGTVISVFRRRPETRVFDLDILNVTRTWQRTAGVGSNGGTGTLSTAVPPDDVFDGIGAGIQALLSDVGRFHIDRRAGLATVTDFSERLDRVGSYLETLHIRASREVHLQARVLEVTLTAGDSIDWAAVRQKLGLPRDSTDSGLGADIDAVQRALTGQGNVNVMSAPDLVTLNNEPAIVRVGTLDDTMVTLTVVPQISPDGLIQLSVSPSVDASAGHPTPKAPREIRVNEADTIARVRDGTTVVLSGFLRLQGVTKKASGFGALFSAQARTTAHVEMVVLIRARVVTPAAVAAGSRP